MWLLPSIHPSFLLRGNRRYLGVLQHDFKRAVALTNGWRPAWTDDNFIFKPSLEQVKAYARRARHKRLSVDIETDGQHPLKCAIRCVGMYDGTYGMCVPLLYRDGSFTEVSEPGKKKPTKKANWRRFYNPEVEKELLLVLKELFNSSKVEGQNFQYDRLCLRVRVGVAIEEYDFDAMLAHHVLVSFLPHGLGFLGSMLTDICHYKSTEKGDSWSSESDEELWLYCIRDCKVQYEAATVLRKELATCRPEDARIYQHDHRKAIEAERWREAGIGVDVQALQLFRTYYLAKAERAMTALRAEVAKMNGLSTESTEALNELVRLMDDEDFKPGSLPQLRASMAVLGVPLEHLTPTGMLSTKKEYLLEARGDLIDGGAKADDPRIAFLDYLFAWRDASKVENTFLRPELMEHPGEPLPRVHPTYNVHVTPTGRLSSSGPNIQTQMKEIRGMFLAIPGHKLVAGDWDSGELRLAGLLSDEKNLIDAFTAFDAGKGPKLHKLNCSRIFKIPIEKVNSDSPMYRAAKCFIYACLYGAGPNKVYENVRKEMPDMQFSHFQVSYENFKKAYPTLMKWQEQWVQQGLRQGYLDSTVLRRREYFLERRGDEESDDVSKMLNMPEQSGLADFVDLANFRILDEVFPKYTKQLKSGEVLRQLTQVHDELVFEVPARFAESFAKDFKKCAERPPDAEHAQWHLPVEVKVKDRWADIPEEVLRGADGGKKSGAKSA